MVAGQEVDLLWNPPLRHYCSNNTSSRCSCCFGNYSYAEVVELSDHRLARGC